MNHTIKYWLFFSIGIYLLLQSCNDDKSPVYEFTAAPELSPLDNSSLVLNEEAENFIAETFSILFHWQKLTTCTFLSM